ncbi:MAG: amidase [Dehalococcoidia bacterium]
MVGPAELWRLGATELAAMARAREVSVREIVQAHLDRIAAVNPRVNAVTVVLAESALAAADAADQAFAAGGPVGPLYGVPMTVKENIDLAGSATSHGVARFAEAAPRVDAPFVAKLRAAGAIPIGRTNLPDFAMRAHTENDLRGATKNPWDSARTPAGSSGGDAAALATGMTPLGIGNDIGGSLRNPSHACGTSALKPGLGRIATHYSLAHQDGFLGTQLFAVQGPMARRVGDLRLAFAVMCGADPRDPWSAPASLRAEQPEQPLRVAVVTDPAGQGVHPDVAAGVQRAAAALRAAGYATEATEPPAVADAARLWARIVLTEMQLGMWPIMQRFASAGAVRFIEYWAEAAPAFDLAGYAAAWAQRNALGREWALFQVRYPLILGPVQTIPPFLVGYDIAGPDEAAAVLRSFRLTSVANLLGLPAAALPAGVANGLPQGVQLIGPRFGEDLCLDAAQAIEDRLGIITPIEPRA